MIKKNICSPSIRSFHSFPWISKTLVLSTVQLEKCRHVDFINGKRQDEIFGRRVVCKETGKYSRGGGKTKWRHCVSIRSHETGETTCDIFWRGYTSLYYTQFEFPRMLIILHVGLYETSRLFSDWSVLSAM